MAWERIDLLKIPGLQFFGAVRWLAPLSGGLLPAALSLGVLRFNPSSTQRFWFGSAPLCCRLSDLQSLKEVLVDEEYRFLGERLRAATQPRILDVGGHIGTFAVWALGVNPNARILSIEADPETYAVAARNAILRGKVGEHWQLTNRAASDRDKQWVGFLQQGPSMGHRVSADGEIFAETISLARAIEKLGAPIDLMKVDIEGSEEDFLCAQPEYLERVTSLVVELHPFLCDTQRVREVLSGRYNTVEEVTGRESGKPLLYCR